MRKTIIYKVKQNQKNKKGFTLIELLIIISIIAILASVILVSMYSAKIKAGDNAAFSSVKSAAPVAYMCLMNGTGGNLTQPTDGSLPIICSSGGVPVVGYSAWPSITERGWNYNSSSGHGFFWCSLINPPTECNLSMVNCGESNLSGSFCYGVKNGSKKIWCTESGCSKVGF